MWSLLLKIPLCLAAGFGLPIAIVQLQVISVVGRAHRAAKLQIEAKANCLSVSDMAKLQQIHRRRKILDIIGHLFGFFLLAGLCAGLLWCAWWNGGRFVLALAVIGFAPGCVPATGYLREMIEKADSFLLDVEFPLLSDLLR